MTPVLKAAAFAILTTFATGSVSTAATVASVDVPIFSFGGIIHEIAQAGHYTLDFTGAGLIPTNPSYLGFGGYVFAEVPGGLNQLADLLDDGVLFSIFDGTSIDLGFLAAGVDFAAGLLSAGNTTMVLTRIDDDPAPVPLPASLPLLLAALGATGVMVRRNRA